MLYNIIILYNYFLFYYIVLDFIVLYYPMLSYIILVLLSKEV